MTYELFLAEAAEARRRFGAAAAGGGTEGSIPGAEARIAALEKALGGVGGTDGAGTGPGFAGKGGEVRCGVGAQRAGMEAWGLGGWGFGSDDCLSLVLSGARPRLFVVFFRCPLWWLVPDAEI